VVQKHCKNIFPLYYIREKNLRQHELWTIINDLGALYSFLNTVSPSLTRRLASIYAMALLCSE